MFISVIKYIWKVIKSSSKWAQLRKKDGFVMNSSPVLFGDKQIAFKNLSWSLSVLISFFRSAFGFYVYPFSRSFFLGLMNLFL